MSWFDDARFGKRSSGNRSGAPGRGIRRRLLRAGGAFSQPTRLRLEALESRMLLTTFMVANTNDSGDGSLRQAILDVNADTGSTSDLIAFNIGGGGVQTIQPLSPLPTLDNPVTIDGETQPGFGGAPLVVLDGSDRQ